MSELDQRLDDVLAVSSDLGFTVFRGLTNFEQHPVALWPDGWEDFLKLGASAGSRLLYAMTRSYDAEAMLEHLLDSGSIDTEEDEADTADNWRRERIVEAIRPWEHYHGQLYAISLAWVKTGSYIPALQARNLGIRRAQMQAMLDLSR